MLSSQTGMMKFLLIAILIFNITWKLWHLWELNLISYEIQKIKEQMETISKSPECMNYIDLYIQKLLYITKYIIVKLVQIVI